jgi:hypothetical protein
VNTRVAGGDTVWVDSLGHTVSSAGADTVASFQTRNNINLSVATSASTPLVYHAMNPSRVPPIYSFTAASDSYLTVKGFRPKTTITMTSAHYVVADSGVFAGTAITLTNSLACIVSNLSGRITPGLASNGITIIGGSGNKLLNNRMAIEPITAQGGSGISAAGLDVEYTSGNEIGGNKFTIAFRETTGTFGNNAFGVRFEETWGNVLHDNLWRIDATSPVISWGPSWWRLRGGTRYTTVTNDTMLWGLNTTTTFAFTPRGHLCDGGSSLIACDHGCIFPPDQECVTLCLDCPLNPTSCRDPAFGNTYRACLIISPLGPVEMFGTQRASTLQDNVIMGGLRIGGTINKVRMRHNTFYSSTATPALALGMDVPQGGHLDSDNQITSNVIYSTDAGGNPVGCSRMFQTRPGPNIGPPQFYLMDYNLFYNPNSQPPPAGTAIDLAGECSWGGPENRLAPWCATWGHDCDSRWGDPKLNTLASIGFNAQPENGTAAFNLSYPAHRDSAIARGVYPVVPDSGGYRYRPYDVNNNSDRWWIHYAGAKAPRDSLKPDSVTFTNLIVHDTPSNEGAGPPDPSWACDSLTVQFTCPFPDPIGSPHRTKPQTLEYTVLFWSDGNYQYQWFDEPDVPGSIAGHCFDAHKAVRGRAIPGELISAFVPRVIASARGDGLSGWNRCKIRVRDERGNANFSATISYVDPSCGVCPAF